MRFSFFSPSVLSTLLSQVHEPLNQPTLFFPSLMWNDVKQLLVLLQSPSVKVILEFYLANKHVHTIENQQESLSGVDLWEKNVIDLEQSMISILSTATYGCQWIIFLRNKPTCTCHLQHLLYYDIFLLTDKKAFCLMINILLIDDTIFTTFVDTHQPVDCEIHGRNDVHRVGLEIVDRDTVVWLAEIFPDTNDNPRLHLLMMDAIREYSVFSQLNRETYLKDDRRFQRWFLYLRWISFEMTFICIYSNDNLCVCEEVSF